MSSIYSHVFIILGQTKIEKLGDYFGIFFADKEGNLFAKANETTRNKGP